MSAAGATSSKLVDKIAAQIEQSDEQLLTAIGADVGEIIDFEADELPGVERLEYLSNAYSIGKKVFSRVNRDLHAIVCGEEAEDEEDRVAILKAIGLDDLALCATIASVMVAALGCSPVVATGCSIVVMRLVVRPGRENICQYWKENLT